MSALAPAATGVWERYLLNPDEFARDAFGIDLDQWQVDALRGVVEHGRIAIRSGHGPGKTTTGALAVLHGLIVVGAVVPCTAPTEANLKLQLWPEIVRWAQRCPEIHRELEISEKRIQLRRDPTVFAVARVAATPEGLAGFHAPRLLYVVDEAAGVNDVAMAVVDGALTTHDAACLMLGNPTKPTGYFIDAFGRNAEQWLGFTISSADSPRVSERWVQEMEDTWGRDSDVFRVRVLGLPPKGEAKGFIPGWMIDQAEQRYAELQPDGPLILGADIARYGMDKTAICGRRGYKPVRIEARHGLSNPEAAAWVAQVAEEMAQPGERVSVRVDDGGVGGGVTDLLRLMVTEGTLTGVEVVAMNFGGKGDQHYATNAGVWYGHLRKLMQEEKLGLPADPELRQQLTTRTFATNTRGKIVLEPKEHMRDRGVPSPDKGDALALAFAPAPAEGLIEWYRRQGIVAGQDPDLEEESD